MWITTFVQWKTAEDWKQRVIYFDLCFWKIILGVHAENDSQGDNSTNREIREERTTILRMRVDWWLPQCGSCEERKDSTHPDVSKSSLYLSFPGGSIDKEWVKVAQSCPTLCNPLDYTVHGILQARILKWVAFPFSNGSSQPRDWTQVSHIAGGFFTSLLGICYIVWIPQSLG